MARYEKILQENDRDQEDELIAILENLKDKQSDLKQINRDIVQLLSEDESENEVTQSDDIVMNIRLVIQKTLKELKSKKPEDKESESNTTLVKEPAMKLPKFTLATFNEDSLKWASFNETFDAAVDSQYSLSTIEKVLYLTRHL